MSILKDFRTMSFIEQMCALNGIEKERKFEAVHELFELYETPLKDKAADSMVIHTLRSLLSQNEEETVRGLQSTKNRVKRLCFNIAGKNSFKSAGPILMALAPNEKDPEVLMDILTALSEIRAPDFLEIFRRYAVHPEAVICTLSIEMLGTYQDIDSTNLLSGIIEEGEGDHRYEKCDLTTWKAIESLAVIGNSSALSFLASKVHHRNPTARRLIQDELVKKGPEAIPFIAPLFDHEDVDRKILAANVLGFIGDKKGGDVLIAALDKGAAKHPNIRYAIYEALGNIPFLKGIICLMDGLSEEDDLLLIVVVNSLDKQINPGAIKKIREFIHANNGQGGRIASAIVSSKSLNIFEALYEDEKVAKNLMEKISKSNDLELISKFLERLQVMDTGRAKIDAARLASVSIRRGAGKRILAVDDSKAMLHFYRSAGSDLGLNITTALNGKEAWDILEKDGEFDLIVTDMNMPIMDGIELTRKINADPAMGKIPVIMITTESGSSQGQLAKKAGIKDFLNKPFTQDAFQEKIRKFLGDADTCSVV